MGDCPIYLDGLASTPLAPEARDAMLRVWSLPGNAGSPHIAGERAAREIIAARCSVAALIEAAPSEIVFTSGATEANNLALLGTARRALHNGDRRRTLVVSAVEHKAVLEPAQLLAAEGFDVRLAPVDRTGRVDLDALHKLVDGDTLLVSIMAANNETGVIQPLAEVSRLARAAGALLHSDAAQAVGKIPLDVVALEVDYLTISAHKLYGPAGVGALFVSAAAPRPLPLQVGGGQQQGLRPGTEPAALIAGFGAALDLARARLDQDRARAEGHARMFLARLAELQVPFAITTGDAPTLAGSLSLSLDGVEADDLVQFLGRNVLVSTGSACTAGQSQVSHVLREMGLDLEYASSVIRLYFHRYLTDADVELAGGYLARACLRLRAATGRGRQ